MSKRILLIEDNASDVELTIRAFNRSELKMEIDVAEDGQDAIDYLECRGRWQSRKGSDLPTLTLLDLKLPKLSGLEVLRYVRSNHRLRRLPIVILTSSKEEQDLELGYDLGANSYVRKPVDFNQFAVGAAHLGHYWLALNEPAPVVR